MNLNLEQTIILYLNECLVEFRNYCRESDLFSRIIRNVSKIDCTCQKAEFIAHTFLFDSTIHIEISSQEFTIDKVYETKINFHFSAGRDLRNEHVKWKRRV